MSAYRGAPKLLSIMIPSRHRFDKLLDCIRTFLSQLDAEQRKLVEFVVKLDSDDEESLRRISELPKSEIEIQVYVADRLEGYKDLYIFYNQCARLSNGRFLLMWNDDAKFKTQNWFSVFLEELRTATGALSYWFAGTPTMIQVEGKGATYDDWPCFVAQHRLFYEIVGFYSHIGGCDSFLYYVLGPLGVLKKLQAIEVDHLAWFQIPEDQRDRTADANAGPGQMLPTDFKVVEACQNRIRQYASRTSVRG